MTAQINNETILNTFTIIRDVLLTDTTISAKLDSKDYYEFMPNTKSIGRGFLGYPFCVINIPTADDDLAFLGNESTERTFAVEIDFYQEYEARSNVKTYISSAMKTLRSSVSTLRSSGYDLGVVNLPVSPQVDYIEEKQVIRSTITLLLHGEVVV